MEIPTLVRHLYDESSPDYKMKDILQQLQKIQQLALSWWYLKITGQYDKDILVTSNSVLIVTHLMICLEYMMMTLYLELIWQVTGALFTNTD